MLYESGRRRFVARDGAFELVAQRGWLAGRWSVAARSPWPGEPMTLYITAGAVHYGYWRDLLVGEDAFDRRHFVYGDNPALLPLVVGPDTRRAIAAAGPAFAVHARHGMLYTEERADKADAALALRHHDVHAAFVADHARAIARWAHFAELFDGRVLAKWPPVLALLRPIGTIIASLAWRVPETSDSVEWSRCGESLVTELLAERARPGPAWRLEPGVATIGAHERIGDRHFEVTGEPTLSRGELADAITRAGIVGIRVARQVVLSLAGMVGERARMDAAIHLMSRLVSPDIPASPYR